jgi:hypothetical protein
MPTKHLPMSVLRRVSATGWMRQEGSILVRLPLRSLLS